MCADPIPPPGLESCSELRVSYFSGEIIEDVPESFGYLYGEGFSVLLVLVVRAGGEGGRRGRRRGRALTQLGHPLQGPPLDDEAEIPRRVLSYGEAREVGSLRKRII